MRRARLVGTALGEERAFGFHAPASGFWNGVAIYRQRAIIQEAKAVALAAVGEDTLLLKGRRGAEGASWCWSERRSY